MGGTVKLFVGVRVQVVTTVSKNKLVVIKNIHDMAGMYCRCTTRACVDGRFHPSETYIPSCRLSKPETAGNKPPTFTHTTVLFSGCVIVVSVPTTVSADSDIEVADGG